MCLSTCFIVISIKYRLSNCIYILLFDIQYSLGQYSVLRASDDDDTPPPVPAYNPNGVQEYSELKREGEKKNKQQQQQQQGGGPLYSTLNQDDDTPPPVPPAYNPEGVQEYSVLRREGEVSD
uniref:Uncharacterized protein n=1 Tax=Amphimedon queenslandica TaxID=400682 RepID=A0A1X7SMF3_AMPQE